MKTSISIAVLVIAAPALAADSQGGQTATGQSAEPVYTVWAFQWSGAQWVKDNRFSWQTNDAAAASSYVQKVNRVPGWQATTNLPAKLTQHGAQPRRTMHAACYPLGVAGSGGQFIRFPYLILTFRIPPGAAASADEGTHDSTSNDNSWQAYQDWQNLQDSLNMINRQMQFDQMQDMINQQNFNNIQDMINAQNMVNNQNMIDAQNAMNAQMNANP